MTKALLFSFSFFVLLTACASSPPAPRIDVMKTGGVYPAKPPGCALGTADINDAAYDRIGMIVVSGGDVDAATVASVRAKACEIGGDALYMNVSGDQMRGYTVLRRRPHAP